MKEQLLDKVENSGGKCLSYYNMYEKTKLIILNPFPHTANLQHTTLNMSIDKYGNYLYNFRYNY